MSEHRRSNDPVAGSRPESDTWGRRWVAAPATRFAQLETTRRGLPARDGTQRSLIVQQAAERALAVGGPPLAKRPLRVPTEALISLAPSADRSMAPLRLLPPSTANDNKAPQRTNRDRLRQTVREAIFLILLGITIAAAFYTGRQNASHNVIVVPGPLSFHAEVT